MKTTGDESGFTGTKCCLISIGVCIIDVSVKRVTCVASVSVEFGSKERPRNGVFGILPAWKMGREPKKER